MPIDLRVATWDANGLINHIQEVEIFLKTNFIDILLISETHFTKKSFCKIKNFDLITANHPNERAHGGSAILIKSNIKYSTEEHITTEYVQATFIKIICNNTLVSICAVYFPPSHNIKCLDYENFFNKLGPRFIVGGDFNAKHPWWGSRLVNPKGRELHKCLMKNNLSTLSTGKPTYWPTDPRKIPDLLDFFIYFGIPSNMFEIKDNYELSSDHSPIILSYNTAVKQLPKSSKLITNRTDMESFSYWIDTNINLNISIENGFELDNAVEKFTNLIHEAALKSTPVKSCGNNQSNFQISIETRELIRHKRRLRKIWQTTRNPNDKRLLNLATKSLKLHLVELKNNIISEFFDSLNNNIDNDHKLWKATKCLKHPTKRHPPFKDLNGTWCRSDSSKADAFANHLYNVFNIQPHENVQQDEDVLQYLEVACQMSLPVRPISTSEIKDEIKMLNVKKSPGYDNIDAKVLKNLTKKAIVHLANIFNTILRINYFPSQWKCAEIIMIRKPNKPENEISSYRPISLLSIFSKIFEKLFLKRLSPILERLKIVPDYQFGFRKKHGTIEQIHRVVNTIRTSFEERKYCSAVFLDIEKAFDRVWHNGLLYKIKTLLPSSFYHIIKSYLQDRTFYVKINDEKSNIIDIRAGVPQGSVLSPILFSIYTADMPILDEIQVSTYADDTAILVTKESPITAANLVQNQLNITNTWSKKWKITVNADKSAHVLFTLRRGDCPLLMLNNIPIPNKDCIKYLGIHLDRRLTWKQHIKTKRQKLNIKNRTLYWLLGRNSKLSIENKLKLYKAILKPVWTYGIELWGTASNSNLEILQRYQSKTLRLIAQAPWYITNEAIHSDLRIPTIKEVIRTFSDRYLSRLENHVNTLAICLLDDTDEIKRLKRQHVLDLPFRR